MATPRRSSSKQRRPVHPFDTERLLRAVQRIQGDRAFQDEAEASAFYAQFTGRPVPEIMAEAGMAPADEAQELAYQALEAEKKSERTSLARKALERDGECTDAQVVLAQEEAGSPKELAARLKLIVDRAEAKLGAPVLRQNRGDLWGLLEARPYLRARLALAEALEKAGKPGHAVPHLEELLKLDAADAQGVKYRLVRCYLAAGQLKPLGQLLKAHEEEDSAFMAWAAVLERVRSKAEKGADKALAMARRVNPHVEEFLTGRRKLPRTLPETYEPGSPEEAATVLKLFGESWSNDREGMYWLFRQGEDKP